MDDVSMLATERGNCPAFGYYPDFDGDGYPTRTEEVVFVCRDDPPPEGYSRNKQDCDDGDPSVWRRLCGDRDGDGAYNLKDVACVGEEQPEGMGPCPVVVEWTPDVGPIDCDDTDPERIDYVYRDGDGDGVGAGSATCGKPGDGWSVYGGDCDDNDANTNPFAVEFADDGVDSDCDGADAPVCMPVSDDQFTWYRSTPENRLCGDLSPGVFSCPSCQITYGTFALENVGDSPFVGDVMLQGDRIDEPIVFSLELAPGERKVLLGGALSGEFLLSPVVASAFPCTVFGLYVEAGHCI